MAVIRTHVVMPVISIRFPRLSKLPHSLQIGSRSFVQQINVPVTRSSGTSYSHVIHRKIMQNLDGLQLMVSFLLSFILIHFKVRIFQNINLLVSILVLTCFVIALLSLLYWKVAYQICLRQVFENNTTVNCFLEMLLFPGVIILKLLLSLLNPVYNTLLCIKPQFKFS